MLYIKFECDNKCEVLLDKSRKILEEGVHGILEEKLQP